MQTRRILSTKILPSHQKNWLLNAGLSVIEFDFIKIVPKDFKLENVNEYLIFTSQNAVQQFLNHPERTNFSTRKCFCVGDKTAQLLKKNHFEIVEKSDNAKSLADLIHEKHKSNAFTFFSGVARLDTLPELLTQNEIRWNEIQVYETVLNPYQFNIEADGVLFFSPSGVESFLIKNSISEAQCFCIGNTTAQKLADFTKNIIIANQPTIENVLIQTINYFKNNQPITQIHKVNK